MATWGVAVDGSRTKVAEDPPKEEETARLQKNPERGEASLARNNPGAMQPALMISAEQRCFRSTCRCACSISPQRHNMWSSQPFLFLLPFTKKARKKMKKLQISPMLSPAELI
jgi:hypothetical protein